MHRKCRYHPFPLAIARNSNLYAPHLEIFYSESHLMRSRDTSPETRPPYMRAFRIRISLHFFHKHESIDGKDSSRWNNKFTRYSSHGDVHEMGSVCGCLAVVREIQNMRLRCVHGEDFRAGLGTHILGTHGAAYSRAAKHWCADVCVSASAALPTVRWSSGLGLRMARCASAAPA